MSAIDNLSSGNAAVILSLAVILSAGFLMTRITKKFYLPDVTAYILAGVLVGPYALNLIPAAVIHGMDFITDIALAYIAFGVGKYFEFSKLRQSGIRVFVITLAEALTAACAIVSVMYFVFRLSLPFSLLLGAIGSATAPASTIMTIRQYRAKGEFVDTLLQTAALDDAVALIAFSICAAIAGRLETDSPLGISRLVLLPLLLNILVLLLGVGCGFVLKFIITARRTREHKLILINAVIFALTGLCSMLEVSPPSLLHGHGHCLCQYH